MYALLCSLNEEMHEDTIYPYTRALPYLQLAPEPCKRGEPGPVALTRLMAVPLYSPEIKGMWDLNEH